MTKARLDSREQERQREVENFTRGWDWAMLFRTWSHRVSDFNAPLNPLFQTASVHDPSYPHGRDVELAWWPAKSIQSLHEESQRNLDRWPGSTPVSPITYNKGELLTLDYLWEHKDDPERVAAILISASLFPRMGSSRAHYPEKWPPRRCASVVEAWAHAKWLQSARDATWHYSSTRVLPTMSEDYYYTIDSMEALGRYLAEEHAALLLTYRPVAIEFVPERNLFLDRSLERTRHYRKG